MYILCIFRFDGLGTGYDLVRFFEENFPDSIPLIGKEKLIENEKTREIGDETYLEEDSKAALFVC